MGASTTNRTSRRLRVLLAEDDPSNQLVAQSALTMFGCDVCLVSDGADAVDSAFDEQFDLIFMDGHMPKLDGWDATRTLRRREQAAGRRRTPIIALTGSAMPHEQENWREAGMDALLIKPFRFEDLKAVLDQFAPSS